MPMGTMWQGTSAMTASVEDVGTVIRNARLRAGLSQRKLAQAAGVTAPYVVNLESGKRRPTLATLQTILAVCGYSLNIQAERVPT
ncbi:couple_hipB, transcriptional regulator, y4mF family [uncultured Caudovirales phage]|uniref:Couple_hipB, transcriptional regulator, y4mF family n=1 Tax=uncultured Caudovirales phage TaxID=2100421 RepID=A0A6J5N9V0_9CAUD|nr:couple_hipB, transcriptional regulator, y4mF family [uncultured Caudovirales phage]